MRLVATPGAFEAFGAYTKRMTARLRAGVHAQTYAHVAEEADRRRLTPTGKLAVQRVHELVALRQQHRRSCDPHLRERALQLLHTLPLLSADEDAHFVTTLRALRLAAYFDAAHVPTTFNLLNQLTRHSYLLDGFNLYTLVHILRDLHHPQTAEVLEIVLPRLCEVGDDMTANEVALVLTMLHTYKVHDTRAQRTLVTAMTQTMMELPVHHTVECVAALACVDAAVARDAIACVSDELAALLRDACAQHRALHHLLLLTTSPSHDGEANGNTSKQQQQQQQHDKDAEEREWRAAAVEELYEVRQLLRELCGCLARLHWAPRRLMNALTSVALVQFAPRPDEAATAATAAKAQTTRRRQQHTLPSLMRLDLCDVVCLMHRVGHRDDRTLLQLVSRIVAARRTQREEQQQHGALTGSGSGGGGDAAYDADAAYADAAVTAGEPTAVAVTTTSQSQHRSNTLLASLVMVLHALAQATRTRALTPQATDKNGDDDLGSEAVVVAVVMSMLDEVMELLQKRAHMLRVRNGSSSAVLLFDEATLQSVTLLLQSLVDLRLLHLTSSSSSAVDAMVLSICTCELLQRYAAAVDGGSGGGGGASSSSSGAAVTTTTQLLEPLVQLARHWCDTRPQRQQTASTTTTMASTSTCATGKAYDESRDVLPPSWMRIIAQLMTSAVYVATTRAYARNDDVARIHAALRVLLPPQTQQQQSSSSSLHRQAAQHMPLTALQQQLQSYASA